MHTMLNQSILLHAQYIQSLYIWGNAYDPDPLEEYNVKLLQEFLRECTNLTSLGLYLYPVNSVYVWRELANTVLCLIERGKLTRLGFYSPAIVEGSNMFTDDWTVVHVLEAIAKSEMACSRLKSLDLAVWSIPNMRVDWIQSKFPKLESLTIRSSLPSMRSMDQWRPLAFLTRLQLNNCDPSTALDIPDLVALFPALRELTVADLYPNDLPFHERYSDGWHLLPTALCNTHRRLDWFHIDHLYLQEIQFMGVIPTRTLIITAVEPKEFVQVLESDPHVFPGLEVIWREMSMEYSGMFPGYTAATESLDRWCVTRNVEVIEGAKGAYEPYSSGCDLWWRLPKKEQEYDPRTR
ncbi:hypothetical protein CPB86DRAFT_859491 [Serendipita vermifera]|nr:hypothetical protein CPB86DRAFT_859491 [Serendipita vermifera]